MPITKTEENKEIAKLFLSGWTCAEIGKVIGVTRQSVNQRLHRMGYTAKDGGKYGKRNDAEILQRESERA
jgi:hypothetical protein